jgi:DNA processing protein
LKSFDEEKLSYLRLIRSENVGPVTFYTLLKYFGSAKEALLHLPDFAKKGGRKRSIKVCPVKEAEAELIQTEKIGGKMIFFNDAEYPKLLKTLNDCPPVLTVLGNTSLLTAKSVAIVGTRDASINGRNMARKLAFEAAVNGFTVVSGMALGIDTAAHEGAIAAALESSEASSTVAVLGCGIDTIYPASNRNLYDKIKQVGLLVSDYPLSSPLNPANFPRRNRIISGLSSGTVVVEARMKSGSLITAGLAADQGRSVMAVPGSPLDERCQGANWLLQNGANLIQTPSDMLSILRTERLLLQDFDGAFEYETDLSEDFSKITEDELTQTRKSVLSLLGNGSVETDELIRESGCPTHLVNVILVELELAGHLERLGGGKVGLLEDTENWN